MTRSTRVKRRINRNEVRDVRHRQGDPAQPTQLTRTRRVKDVMNPDIMTVADDMTSGDLVRFLNEREISGAPVVDSQGHFIGVVSMTDIARHLSEPSEFVSAREEFYQDAGDEVTLEDFGQRYVEERAVTVRDVMTPSFIM